MADIYELTAQRKFYQIQIAIRRPGANRRYYEDLLSKNTRQLHAAGANVFDIDDANAAEVEAEVGRISSMTFGQKLSIASRHWLSRLVGTSSE